MSTDFNVDEFTNELAEAHFTQSEINQFVKAREQSLIIPRRVKDLDVIREFRSVCKGKNLDVYQQQEILLGIEHKVDVSKYADRKFTHVQMEQIRIGLQKGVDITKYVSSSCQPYVMRHLRILMEKKMSKEVIDCFVKKSESMNYFRDLEALRFALEEGVSPEKILKMRNLTHDRLDKERLDLKK